MSPVVVLVVLGFPVALVLTWALELTPDGVRVTSTATAAMVRPPSSAGAGASPESTAEQSRNLDDLHQVHRVLLAAVP